VTAVATDPDVRQSFSADASGLVLLPDGVARPTGTAMVSELLAEAGRTRTAVTAAGGQTSTTGASITDRGIVLSTRGLDRILEIDPVRRIARVEAGVLIGDLQRALAPHQLFFAPDPTSDQECTVGGAIACNASGPRTLRYGATRSHVRALRVALIGGELIDVRRPELEKNTVGYPPLQDLVDWFVGSEGTLGVVVEAELGLLEKPALELGLAIPFSTEAAALAFVVAARTSERVSPRCLEYLDRAAAEIAREDAGTAVWPAGVGAVVYVEEAGNEEPPLDDWLELAERAGADPDLVNAFHGDTAIALARRLRHAVPARMHERATEHRPAGGRRVSTDWAVPYRRLAETIEQVRAWAADAGLLPPVVFGHAGNGHPHCNYIGRDDGEVRRIEAVVERTLRQVLALGGTVAAEHGIGKIKAKWLPLQLGPTEQRLLRAIKRELDPDWLLAPGNIVPGP
jgi:FAD/FMN-containing dehydrogenase